MEIKTTQEMKTYIESLVERSGHFMKRLSDWDEGWVKVNDLKEFFYKSERDAEGTIILLLKELNK